MDRSTISIRMDPRLWKEVKKLAIDKDMSISEFVEGALKEKVKSKGHYNIT